jgi:hypothetical protein
VKIFDFEVKNVSVKISLGIMSKEAVSDLFSCALDFFSLIQILLRQSYPHHVSYSYSNSKVGGKSPIGTADDEEHFRIIMNQAMIIAP